MRTSYQCRAYPTPEHAAVFNHTFGCVRLVRNKTLADRHAAFFRRGEKTSAQQTDAALTAWRKTEDLALPAEVCSVRLQRALRHQHAACGNLFARSAHYPRIKSRTGTQSAHHTRSAFRIKDGQVHVAKTDSPLRVAWSWPDVDLVTLDPTMMARKQRGSANRRKARTKVAVAHRKIRHAAHAGRHLIVIGR